MTDMMRNSRLWRIKYATEDSPAQSFPERLCLLDLAREVYDEHPELAERLREECDTIPEFMVEVEL